MFTTRELAVKPKPSISPTYYEASLFPILPWQQLLTGPRQALSQQISSLASVPPEHQQELYGNLLANFAEFVQLIPSVNGGPIGEMLQTGLQRGVAALQQYQSEIGEQSPDPKFTYALFSAALLLDVRQILVDKQIMISDAQGRFIKEWSPFDGAMLSMGNHYKIRRYDRPVAYVSRQLNVLFATKLMPKLGLSWLAANLDLLNMWLAVLVGDEAGAGSLGRILALTKLKINARPGSGGFTVLPAGIRIDEPAETAAGEAFVNWLRKHANYIMPDGNVPPEVFEKFSQQNPKFSDWKQVVEQFKLLGLTSTDANLPPKKTEKDFKQKAEAKELLKQTLLGREQRQGEIKTSKALTNIFANERSSATTPQDAAYRDYLFLVVQKAFFSAESPRATTSSVEAPVTSDPGKQFAELGRMKQEQSAAVEQIKSTFRSK